MATAAKTATTAAKGAKKGSDGADKDKEDLPFCQIPIHTIILFPVDYDHPDNDSLSKLSRVGHVLGTHAHPELLRDPALPDDAPAKLTGEAKEKYHNMNHFIRVKTRLNFDYTHPDGRREKIASYADEKIKYLDGHDGKKKRSPRKGGKAIARGKEIIHFIHHMPVFMETLRKDHKFRTIYAPNLQSALDHAQDITDDIAEAYPRTLKTPVSASSAVSSVDPYDPSPTTPRGTKVKEDGFTPRPRVMIFAYRLMGSIIQIDARAHETFMHEKVVMYPSEAEVGWDNQKVHDLGAFDAIKREGAWRPSWHACHPRENPDGCELPGDMAKEPVQLLKRSHSCCTRSVKRVEWDEYKQPACLGALSDWRGEEKREDLPEQQKRIARTELNVLAQKAQNYILHDSHFYKYIHQEFVESLYRWGEIRVFVATRWAKSTKGKKVRAPYVVDMIKTTFPRDKEKKGREEDPRWARETKDLLKKKKAALVQELQKRDPGAVIKGLTKDGLTKRIIEIAKAAAAPADEDDEEGEAEDGVAADSPIVRCTYSSPHMAVSRLNLASTAGFRDYPSITCPVIEKFALAQYRRLWRRFPATFGSLDVGARIDLGVAPDGKGLFINEVTRWWFASWFSGYEDVQLQTRVAEGFAKSFAEIYTPDYPAGTRTGEEAEESEDAESDDDDGEVDEGPRRSKRARKA